LRKVAQFLINASQIIDIILNKKKSSKKAWDEMFFLRQFLCISSLVCQKNMRVIRDL
jgi:hypothetical protein